MMKALTVMLNVFVRSWDDYHQGALWHQVKSPSNVSPSTQHAWRINMEHMKKNSNGEHAVRFLNAGAFFNRNKVEEDLINIGKPQLLIVIVCHRLWVTIRSLQQHSSQLYTWSKFCIICVEV